MAKRRTRKYEEDRKTKPQYLHDKNLLLNNLFYNLPSMFEDNAILISTQLISDSADSSSLK